MEIKDIRRNNINLLADKYGRTAIAEKLGYPDNNYINQLCGGHTNIGSRTARKIEIAFNLERGSMDLLQRRYEAPLTQKHEVREPSVDYIANVAPGPRIQGHVPVISWIQAGAFCEAVDPFEPGDAEEWLPCPAKHSDRAYALRVKGDSMTSPHPGQKSYPEGTYIFVDPEKPLTNGCRVVAKLNGEVTFKTYAEDMGRTFLRPINPSYPAMDITDKDVTFCGVLLGSYSSE